MRKTLIESFESIEDPRSLNIRHKLIDIILISILAILCGANDFNEIEDFGNSKKKWLKKYLELPKEIPSHDTFNRVLSTINPTEFHNCFMDWVNLLHERISKELISIDGKTIRRTKDKSKNLKAAQIVSAWSNENQIVLGQLKVDDKSNEITAIPELLKLLDIKGCIITIDAIGTQCDIVKTIVKSGAEYTHTADIHVKIPVNDTK